MQKNRAWEQGCAITTQTAEHSNVEILIWRDLHAHLIIEACQLPRYEFQQIILDRFNTENKKHTSESLVTN